MSSTYKTTYLGLNQFVGSDKPKMEDVNFDNQLIDQKMKEHMESDLHLSIKDREILNGGNWIRGTYTGTGMPTQKINLEKEVEFGFVFAENQPLTQIRDSENTAIWAAVLMDGCSSAGVSIEPGGFVVHQTNLPQVDKKKNCLNISNQKYGYLIFPKKGEEKAL